MARAPYQITRAPYTLHTAGVRYFETGTLRSKSGAALFDYYKTDSVTPEQIAELRTFCPDMRVMQAAPAYAPEQRKPIICFPKAAWYRDARIDPQET